MDNVNRLAICKYGKRIVGDKAPTSTDEARALVSKLVQTHNADISNKLEEI